MDGWRSGQGSEAALTVSSLTPPQARSSHLLQSCDPGPPPGGRGGRSQVCGRRRGSWRASSRECCCWGNVDHFFPQVGQRPRRGWATCSPEKAAGWGAAIRLSPARTHALGLPKHKSLCMRPSSGERPVPAPNVQRDFCPSLENLLLLPAPLFRGLPRLPPHVCCSRSHSRLRRSRRFGYLLTLSSGPPNRTPAP